MNEVSVIAMGCNGVRCTVLRCEQEAVFVLRANLGRREHRWDRCAEHARVSLDVLMAQL